MTGDYIHDFELNVVQGYVFRRKSVTIDGYETDKAKLISLWELFGRAEYNVVQKDRPSGPSYLLDLTSDQRNIVYCTFATDELIDGWYAIKSFGYIPRQGRLTHYPWRISLVFIGTHAQYQQFYGITDAESVANDWSI